MLLTEPFLSAEIDYRRERAMGGRGTHTSRPVSRRRLTTRTSRARLFVHRFAVGH